MRCSENTDLEQKQRGVAVSLNRPQTPQHTGTTEKAGHSRRKDGENGLSNAFYQAFSGLPEPDPIKVGHMTEYPVQACPNHANRIRATLIRRIGVSCLLQHVL